MEREREREPRARSHSEARRLGMLQKEIVIIKKNIKFHSLYPKGKAVGTLHCKNSLFLISAFYFFGTCRLTVCSSSI